VPALRTGKIDFLSTATPSVANLAGSASTFSRLMLFDFQALMVNCSLNIKSARDLAGKKVCYLVETNIEVNLQAYMQRHQIKFIPFPFQEEGEMEAAFSTGNCVAITADVTMIAYERVSFRKMAVNFEILPDVIAKTHSLLPSAVTIRRSALSSTPSPTLSSRLRSLA